MGPLLTEKCITYTLSIAVCPVDKTKDLSLNAVSQRIALRDCSEEVREEPG